MVNRLACELLHRGVEPPRLTLDERDDDLPDIALTADDEEQGRDLNANSALVDTLRGGLTSWLAALSSSPEVARERLRAILMGTVKVTPQGEGRSRVWAFEGTSKVDGAVIGSVALEVRDEDGTPLGRAAVSTMVAPNGRRSILTSGPRRGPPRP